MKLARLIDSGFQNSVRTLMKQPLPLKAAYKLRGVVKKAEAELTQYEEMRKEALQKYGKKKEDGTLDTTETNNVQFETQETLQVFLKDIGDLTNVDVDMPAITLTELGADIRLSTEDLMNLEGLIVD